MAFDTAVEALRPLVSQIGSDLPIEFLMAWMQKESGGNFCSIGACANSANPDVALKCNAPGADFNKEVGLFQIYFDRPNYTVDGATLSQLRAYCGGLGGTQTRDLTADEQTLQVTSGVQSVREMRDKARTLLNGQIDETSVDFWKFVKFLHAYPAHLMSYVQTYGAPTSWDQFATWESGRNSGKYKDGVANAAWTGAYGGGPLSPIDEQVNNLVNGESLSWPEIGFNTLGAGLGLILGIMYNAWVRRRAH